MGNSWVPITRIKKIAIFDMQCATVLPSDLFTLKFYSWFTLTLQSLQHFKQAQRILFNGFHTIEATFLQHQFFWSSGGPRQRTTRTESHLGPVSRKPRKLFGPVKPWQNLEPYDYRAVLFTYSYFFIQEVSGVCTSPFLDTDNLKMALRARKGSRNGRLVWKSCTPHVQPTLCRRNMKTEVSFWKRVKFFPPKCAGGI